MKKAIVGSVLAAGLAASLFGAGAASADAGVSFSGNGADAVGFGDQGAGGAVANSGKVGNQNNALAISTGLSPTGAIAVATGEHNNVVSIDGVGITGPGTARNNVVTVAGATILAGDAHDNTVLNVGSVVTTKKLQGTAPGVTSISACGSTLSGQADHITVSKVPGGIC